MPREMTREELQALRGGCTVKAAAKLVDAYLAKCDEVERMRGDTATLRGFIKTHGCTPSMMHSRATVAEKKVERLRGVLERVKEARDGWLISRCTGSPDAEHDYAMRLNDAISAALKGASDV
jgi:hypothetical protein